MFSQSVHTHAIFKGIAVKKIKMTPIGGILPYDKNVKKHPPEQIAKIVESIKNFGWDQPIVVDKDNIIIKGHGRRLAAIELGLTEVPVLVRNDLTEEQVKASRVADNRASLSDIDTEMLRLELVDINMDLLAGIFDAKELDFFVADLGSMNTGAFVDNLDAAVVAQKAATEEKMEELKGARVSVKKALGFESFLATDQIDLNRFMAGLEHQSSLKGEEAFMHFVKNLLSSDSK